MVYPAFPEALSLVIIAEPDRASRGALARRVPPSAPYEPEHSEQQVSGSVAAGEESRWFATLAVALTGDQSILLSIERDGPVTPGAPAVEDVALVIPSGEADAVLTLLHGVVAHARRDGVLPEQTAT